MRAGLLAVEACPECTRLGPAAGLRGPLVDFTAVARQGVVGAKHLKLPRDARVDRNEVALVHRHHDANLGVDGVIADGVTHHDPVRQPFCKVPVGLPAHLACDGISEGVGVFEQ